MHREAAPSLHATGAYVLCVLPLGICGFIVATQRRNTIVGPKMHQGKCWAPDQAGSKIPDVSGLNVGLFGSLESSLMSPRLFTSSEIHFNQTDIPADRNLPPTCAG